MDESTATDEEVDVFVEITDILPVPETRGEIEVILQAFPKTGDTFYGVAWTLIHILEASPLWLELSNHYERPNYGADEEWLEKLQTRISNWRNKQNA